MIDFQILCILKISRVSWFVQKRILFLQREFSPSVENRARILLSCRITIHVLQLNKEKAETSILC